MRAYRILLSTLRVSIAAIDVLLGGLFCVLEFPVILTWFGVDTFGEFEPSSFTKLVAPVVVLWGVTFSIAAAGSILSRRGAVGWLLSCLVLSSIFGLAIGIAEDVAGASDGLVAWPLTMMAVRLWAWSMRLNLIWVAWAGLNFWVFTRPVAVAEESA